MTKKEKAIRRKIRRRLWCLVLLTATGGMLIHSAVRERYQITHYDVYEVKDGDSLWSIASDTYNDTVDIRDMISLIKDINGIEDCVIHNGDCLSLPMSEQIAKEL